MADMLRKRTIDRLVVGVAQYAADGGHEGGVGRVGEIPLPAIIRDPAASGQAPLTFMLGAATGHGTDHLHRDLFAVHHREVLCRRHEKLSSLQRLTYRPGAHEGHRRAHGRVPRAERRPCQRGHMPLWRHGAQIIMRAGQDRAIVGPAQGHCHRVLAGYVDDGTARLERLEPVWRQIFLWVLRIQLLYIDVLIIKIGRGDPPSQLLAAACQDGGHAGDCAADHAATFQLQPRQIPDRGRGKAQMRIIGQQRATRRRTRRRGSPGVRGSGEFGRREGRQRIGWHRHASGVARQIKPGHQLRIVGQGGDTRSRRVGQDIDQTGGILQHQRHSGAPYLVAHLRRQLHRHQLDDRDTVCRGPGRHWGIEEEHLGCAASQ